MRRIRGFYEYDDDDLTPGKKKEGGLHQNLYNSDGDLKGNARFIPDEKQADKPGREKKPSGRTSKTERGERGGRQARRSEERADNTGRRSQRRNNQTSPDERRGRAHRQARGGGEQRKQPEPEVVNETVYVHETIYVHDEGYVHDEEFSQQLAREREEEARRRAAQAELIADMVRLLVKTAAPHAKRLWEEKGRPKVEARRAKKAARKADKAAPGSPIVVEAEVLDSGRELAVAEQVYRADMSSAEAQARYLAALAARAFSDEQMKLVLNANIVDGVSLDELEHTLGQLPPQHVRGIIEAVEADPALLSGDLLAELGKLIGLDRAQPHPVPIEKRNHQ